MGSQNGFDPHPNDDAAQPEMGQNGNSQHGVTLQRFRPTGGFHGETAWWFPWETIATFGGSKKGNKGNPERPPFGKQFLGQSSSDRIPFKTRGDKQISLYTEEVRAFVYHKHGPNHKIDQRVWNSGSEIMLTQGGGSGTELTKTSISQPAKLAVPLILGSCISFSSAHLPKGRNKKG